MLLAALVLAALRVLPVRANDCNPDRHGLVRCELYGGHAVEHVCDGAGTWWNTGKSCNPDAENDSKCGAMHRPPPKTPEWPHIPDCDGLDTRPSLNSVNVIEKFDPKLKQWVNHYKCPPGTSCFDLHGKGACRAGDNEYTVPGLRYLWKFKCANGFDFKTCRFADSVYKQKGPKPHEPYLTGSTRCSPDHRAIQYRNGVGWEDVYYCNAEAACVESAGRAGCQDSSLVFPLKSRSESGNNNIGEFRIGCEDSTHCGYYHNAPTERGLPSRYQPDEHPPTRCNPYCPGNVQFFSQWYNGWIDFLSCDSNDGCFNEHGRAHCSIAGNIVVPFVDLPNGLYGWHPPVVPIRAAAGGGKEERRPVTRCDPRDDRLKRVQYLHSAGKWLSFYQCHGHCKQFPKYAACEERRNKFVVPSPPTQHQGPVSRSADPHVIVEDDVGEGGKLLKSISGNQTDDATGHGPEEREVQGSESFNVGAKDGYISLSESSSDLSDLFSD